MRGDPLATRARHWARWRRHRLAALWRHRCHVDLLGDEARAAWLCSWQRSGSTLLAQVLTTGHGTRLVYEPANLPDRLFRGEDAARTALPRGPGPELEAVEAALRGRVHGSWVDQLAEGHVFARRVVKDVRAIGLLGLVAARHPATPIVVLVRHPLSVARSAVELGWAGDDPGDAVLDEVSRWSALHGTALRGPSSRRVLVVAYEHLVLQPEVTLDLVLAHLASAHATWRDLRIDRARLTAPSATSFRRGAVADPKAWVGDFDDLAPSVVEAAVAALRDAGLGDLYGPGPEPLVGPHDVGRASRG